MRQIRLSSFKPSSLATTLFFLDGEITCQSTCHGQLNMLTLGDQPPVPKEIFAAHNKVLLTEGAYGWILEKESKSVVLPKVKTLNAFSLFYRSPLQPPPPPLKKEKKKA